MTDNNQRVRDAIASKPYPITAAYIGQLTNLDKSAINKVLYAGKATLFEQLECVPPLWRNRPIQTPTAQEPAPAVENTQ